MSRFLWPVAASVPAPPFTSDSDDHVARGEGLAVDIGNRTGTPLLALHDGDVTGAGLLGDCGLHVQLEWDDVDGHWLARYCHLSKIDVARGASVAAGDKIGELGNTGKSTGPHLHLFLERDGARVRPEEFLLEDTMDIAEISRSLGVVWGWAEALEHSKTLSKGKKAQAAKEMKDSVISIKEQVGLP